MPIPKDSGSIERSGVLVRCTNCPTVGYAGDRYCPACGSPMQRRCPWCSAVVYHLIAHYCTQCGSELEPSPPEWIARS